MTFITPDLLAKASDAVDVKLQSFGVDPIVKDGEVWLGVSIARTVLEVVRQPIAEGKFVVSCARCGEEPVVAPDAINSDMQVCGTCGVNIGREMRNVEVTTPDLTKVDRVEVIDSTGRAFTRRYTIAGATLDAQNDGRTVKVYAEERAH